MNEIDPKNCFLPLKQKSSHIVDFCNKLLSRDAMWAPYIGWDVVVVDKEEFIREPALRDIDSQFTINRAAILKTDPYQLYAWHKDEYRGVCINMILTPEWPSHCLFGRDKDYTNKYFTELNYEPDTFYVFNNQVSHCVINFDQPRYMFSVEFSKSLDTLNFPEIRDWAIANNV